MNEYILNLIRDFNNDPDVIELNNYYRSTSSMETLRVTTNEMAHSSFLACLFNPEVNYGLGTTPLLLLLDLLIKTNPDSDFLKSSKNSIILRTAKINASLSEVEFPYDKECRIDIFIRFSIDDKQYAIVLENKVKSKENQKEENVDSNSKETVNGKKITQTEKYYRHINKNDGINYIYVFLAPSHFGSDNKEEKMKAKNENFINISYTDIVKYIITPILSDNSISEIAKYTLNDYLKALTKPNVVNSKNDNIKLATSEYETKKLETIRNNHTELKEKLEDINKNKNNNNDEETIFLEQFVNEGNNKFVVLAAWPKIMSKRRKNRTFGELGIEPGTILTLAVSSGSNIKDKDTVKTIDSVNKVEYTDRKGNTVVSSISPAAQYLTNKEPLNGFAWFIDDTKGNLVNIEIK